MFKQIALKAKSKMTDGENKTEIWKARFIRFVKFNAIGFVVFLVGTTIYLSLFRVLGIWSYIIASTFGGIFQFVVISYLNTKKKGNMFNSCETKSEESKKP